jgi:hypothetical protein
VVLAGAGLAASADAQSVVSADTISTDDTRNFLDYDLRGADAWYIRGFDSLLFEDDPSVGDAARGASVRVDETFLPFTHLRIRKIWILNREAFGRIVADADADADATIDESMEVETGWFTGALNSLTTATHEWVIWQYILFKEGSYIDPYELADTERILRNLRFISDAKVEVFPLEDQPGWADVAVYVRDRWPLGVKAKVITKDRYNVEFFHRNIGGTGLNFEWEIPVNRKKDPPRGRRLKLSYANILSTFTDIEVQTRTDYEKEEYSGALRRDLVHPGIKLVGGVSASRRTDKDLSLLPEGVFLRTDIIDPWVGWNFLIDDGDDGQRQRMSLIPAVRVEHVNYRSPPREFAEEEDSWLDVTRTLGQLSLAQIDYHTMRLVYSYGETEDLPVGVWISGVGGRENGELADRLYHGVETMWSILTGRDASIVLSAAYGGFRYRGRVEDAVLELGGGGFSALRRYDFGYVRHFLQLRYTHGFNRTVRGRLRLDESALRDLDSGDVAGDQRITAEVESVLFTRYALLGFKIAAFGYVGGGFIGAEDEALFDERFSMNFGVGLRLNNPHLVIPTTELRTGLLSTEDGVEVAFYFRMKDVNPFRRNVPSIIPTVVEYR